MMVTALLLCALASQPTPQRVLIQIETVQELEDHGVITKEAAALEIARYRGLAPDAPDVSGVHDFLDIVWIAIGALLFIGLIGLVGLYLVPLLKRAPKWLIELLIYAACVAFLIVPYFWIEGGGAIALALVGCLGLIGGLLFSHDLHFRRLPDAVAVRLYSAILTGAWAFIAVLYQSQFIAFLACVVLMWTLGVFLLPLLEWVEFKSKRYVPLGMLCAAGLIVSFGGLMKVETLEAYIEVFQVGALSSGATVYFAGCLALASWHYNEKKIAPFVVGQIIALASGLGMLFVGALAHLDIVRETGGTFLAVYILEKFFELPWNKKRWVWMCLGLALLLYSGAQIIERYPEYFLLIGP